MQHEFLVDATRAHGPDQPACRGILQPGRTGVIAARITAPVARESEKVLVWLHSQDSLDLRQYLLVAEMTHGDCILGALRRACATSRARSLNDHRQPLCLPVGRDYSIIGAYLGTDTTEIALVCVDLRRYRFDLGLAGI